MLALLTRPRILLAILIGLLAAAAAYQSHRASSFKAAAAAAKQRATELTGALASANGIVDQLVAGNKKLIQVATLQKEMLEAAGDRLEESTRELAKWKNAITVKEDRDRALPDCQKLLQTDLGASCPGHLDGMRARANRLP